MPAGCYRILCRLADVLRVDKGRGFIVLIKSALVKRHRSMRLTLPTYYRLAHIRMNMCCVCNGQHFQQSMDQPGNVANPVHSQLNRDFLLSVFLSTFTPEKLVSQNGFGRPVPR